MMGFAKIHIGQKGENIANQFLIQRQYHILEHNYRYQHFEVDIIAAQKNILHFIEVKTRTQQDFGHPEHQVNKGKITNMLAVAEHYQLEEASQKKWTDIQFDIIAILLDKATEQVKEIKLIEDIYL